MEIDADNINKTATNTATKWKVMSPVGTTESQSSDVAMPSKNKSKIYPKNLKRVDYEKAVGISSQDLEYLISKQVLTPITIPKIGVRFLESDVTEIFEKLCTVQTGSDFLGVSVEDFLEAVAVKDSEETSLRLITIQDTLWMIKSSFYEWFNLEEEEEEEGTAEGFNGVGNKDNEISMSELVTSNSNVTATTPEVINHLASEYNCSSRTDKSLLMNNRTNSSHNNSNQQEVDNENHWDRILSEVGVREEKNESDF